MNNAGSIVWLSEYKPYGELYGESGSVTIGDPNSTGIVWKPPFRFPGQYADPETGLHYNHWRYYQPTLGNYTRSDPTGIHRGFNFAYVYGANNPLRFSDPSGLEPKPSDPRAVWAEDVLRKRPPCPGECDQNKVKARIEFISGIIMNLQITNLETGPIRRDGETGGSLDHAQSPGNSYEARPWILTGFGACIEYCMAAHEFVHREQYFRGGYFKPTAPGNELYFISLYHKGTGESEAYVAELHCLEGFLR